MVGAYKIKVYTKKLEYNLEIRRNITFIRGDSGTGKTTLFNMIRSFARGRTEGVTVECNVKCKTLPDEAWKYVLSESTKSIIFIDEEQEFLYKQDFIETIKNSDNYFVIITRYDIDQLPYSINEIYTLESSKEQIDGRIKWITKMVPLYRSVDIQKIRDFTPDIILTEDSGSGHYFFREISKTKCISAHGRTNIAKCLKNLRGLKVLVIADGAALGSVIRNIYIELSNNYNAKLYTPESFEWFLIKADIIPNRTVENILVNPFDYIDSIKYFSWENYFTALAIKLTSDLDYMEPYSKSTLRKQFLSKTNQEKALVALPSFIKFVCLE